MDSQSRSQPTQKGAHALTRPPNRLFLIGLPVLLALLLSVSFQRGTAQVVQGRLLDADTGSPVEGALVTLSTPNGTVHNQRLTNPQGRFLLRSRGPGTFLIRAERIGFQTVSSATFSLSEGQLLRIDLETGRDAIQLDGITVQGEQRCVVRPGEGLEIARVWEEARKALTVQRWTEQEGSYWFQVQNYSRDLDRDARRVLNETRSTRAGLSQSPIGSLPAEELMAEGFIQRNPDASLQYYGPDASTLLSDIFLDSHCFELETDGDEPGLLGLAFEPVEQRDIPDIQGTLWLDRSSSALQFLEYRYTWAPHPDARRLARGRVDFEELPNGAWIVRKWWIQMPQIGREDPQAPWWERAGGRIGVAGIRETGAEVVGIRTSDRQEVARAERGLVAGLVWDSTRTAPLEGAQIYLLGTSYTGTSNAEGRFLIDGVPEGVFRATFEHPRLDTLATSSPGTEVEVVPGEASEILLGVPSIPSIIAELCAGVARDEASGVISGLVLEPVSGRPIPEASVSLSWQAVSREGGRLTGDNMLIETTTDDDGRFTVCNTPTNELVEIQARAGRGRSDVLEYRVQKDSYTTIGIEVDPTPDAAASDATNPAESPVGARTVRGQVVDSVAGAPVEFARVTLVDEDGEDVALAVSDIHGRFQVQASEPGRYRLRVKADFYEESSHGPFPLTAEEGRSVTLELNPLPVELRGLVVDAERQSPRLAMEGVYDRMANGFGDYFDRDRIEARPGRSVSEVVALLPMVELWPDTIAGISELRIVFRRRQIQRFLKEETCFPQVFLDGGLLHPGGTQSGSLSRISLNSMEAIEVYESPAFLPSRFHGSNAACGTIVLWSRGGGGS